MKRIITEILPKYSLLLCTLFFVTDIFAQWQNQSRDTLTSNSIREQVGFQSMAIDNNNSLHVIFQREKTSGWDVFYMKRDCEGIGWTVPVLVNGLNESAFQPTMAVTDSGVPYVAYQSGSGTAGEIVVATDSQGIWVRTTLTSNNKEDLDPSIAVDNMGDLHVAYITTDANMDYKMAYATNYNGIWNTQIIAGTYLGNFGSGAAPYIAVDPAQRAHIVHRGGNYLSYKVDHVYNSVAGGSIWAINSISTGNGEDYVGNIVITADTVAHIAISGNSGWGFPNSVYYTQKPWGGTYATALQANTIANGHVSSLFIDDLGKAHLTYEGQSGNFLTGNIYYATNANGFWSDSSLVPNNESYQATMVMDPAGKKYAAYYGGATFSSQEIYVIYTGSCTQVSRPVTAFTANTTFVCVGGTVTFTDNSTNNPTSHTWTFSGGTPATSTAANPTVTYNTPGMYDVKLVVTNGSGSDSLTMTSYITVNPAPIADAGNTQTICRNESAPLNATGGSSFSWLPANSLDDASIANPVATPLFTTTYTVTVTDNSGCSDTDTVTITVNPVPMVPTISQNGDVLTSSATSGNQWYFNNSPISNANGQTHTMAQSGDYFVVVTNEFGCSASSDTLNFTKLSIAAKEMENIKIYMSGADLVVEMEEMNGEAFVSVHNMLGQKVLNNIIKNKIERFRLDVPAGVYLVDVRIDERAQSVMVFVQE